MVIEKRIDLFNNFSLIGIKWFFVAEDLLDVVPTAVKAVTDPIRGLRKNGDDDDGIVTVNENKIAAMDMMFFNSMKRISKD